MRGPALEEAPSEIPITLVDKNHVTLLVIFISFITFVCLYATYQNQARIEQAAVNRCEQRMRLESLVSKEAVALEHIDEQNLGQAFPAWVRERRESLEEYTQRRRILGQEQCEAIRR